MTDLSDRLANLSEAQRALLNLRLEAKRLRPEPIAIIGMACRFPGADEPRRLLATAPGRRRRRHRGAARSRWDADAYYDPDPGAPGKMNTRWGGFLDGTWTSSTPASSASRRARRCSMDPQQRLLLEVAWEALEDAGVRARSPGGHADRRLRRHLHATTTSACSSPATSARSTPTPARATQLQHRRQPDLVPARPPRPEPGRRHRLLVVAGGRPPRVPEPARGECDLALAGGVNLILSPELDHRTSPRPACWLPTGAARPSTPRPTATSAARAAASWCSSASPTRWPTATRSMAVIRGTAVNQDGRSNGLTAPNGLAQEAVMRDALADAPASRRPRSSYVEAHGTGTPLGDPIEVRALGAVLGRGPSGVAASAIGSVKTNIGHLEAAAGIAGLIKVVLATAARRDPAQPALQDAQPATSPSTSCASTSRPSSTPWPRVAGQPLVAGVSSFGFGGTNAHLVLEEAPPTAPAADGTRRRAPAARPAPFRRAASAALRGARRALPEHLAAGVEEPLADLCFTANTGRTTSQAPAGGGRVDPARISAVSSRTWRARTVRCVRRVRRARERRQDRLPVHRPGLAVRGYGAPLFETQPAFRARSNAAPRRLRPTSTGRCCRVLFPEPGAGGRCSDETAYTQPALFALEYALAELWRSWGIVAGAPAGPQRGRVRRRLRGRGLQLWRRRSR